MSILAIKALHIIFIVSWFAGLFFLGRMFVYHREALDREEGEAKEALIELFTGAEKRVWFIIVIPAIVMTLIWGGLLTVKTGAYREGWFHMKMLAIMGFLAYNIYCGKIRKRLAQGDMSITSLRLRLLNEVPFLFLLIIVFTAFMKAFFSGLWALGVVLVMVGLLMVVAQVNRRKKS